MTTRRQFLGYMGALAIASSLKSGFSIEEEAMPLNVLLITADDLHWGSPGSLGGKPKGITPNLDAFANEGMSFEQAHVNVGICMPSRAVLGTGLYSHSSGAMGFMHADKGTPTVVRLYQKAGYLAGLLGKQEHSTPCAEDEWDFAYDRYDLGNGRAPEKYYQRCKDFFTKCKKENKPFYFMVNSHDPHRPFHDPKKPLKGAAEPSKLYKPQEADVPGFLPDLPGVRKEFSQYLNSVRRLDDTFGKIMQALDESGFKDNTLVMFLSDNGAAFPFAKCNCYLASTKTPWLVRWPGVAAPGSIDSNHFISGVDFLPTILEACGIKSAEPFDGQSFVPLLKGGKQGGRAEVFTQIDGKSSGPSVPMRCVQNATYGYIFNAWSDGKFKYKNANEGQTMKAMEKAAEEDQSVADRIQVYRYRTREELYNLEKDPNCLDNLFGKPEHQGAQAACIAKLSAWMKKTKDPLLSAFENRHDKAAMKKAMKKDYLPRIKPRVKKKK